MIRRILTQFLAIALISAASAQNTKPKVATLDMQQLFKEYFKTNEAQQQINVERAKIQKENNEKLTSIRDLESALAILKKEIEDTSLSEERRQKAYKEHQTKFQEAVQLDKDRREYLGRKNQVLNDKMAQRMKGILEEIRKVVEERAKADDFDYVFDKSGTSTSQVPFVLYVKDETDITAALLKELNKDAPPEFLTKPE